MPQPSNVDVVQANSAAFSRRDLAAMLKLFDTDALVFDRRPVGFGEFRGHDAISAYYQGLFDNLDKVDENLKVVSEQDGVVIASCHLEAVLTGQPDDEPVTFDYALKVGVEDGRITSLEIFDDAEAAAGFTHPG